MITKILWAFLVSLLLLACSTTEPSMTTDKKPSWILDPNQGGVIGAVGECGVHYKGKAMQRKLAISRAIEELAMQGDITVDSEMSLSTEVSGRHVKNISKSKTFVSAKGVKVHAYIEEMYFDKKSEILYVWMIKN